MQTHFFWVKAEDNIIHSFVHSNTIFWVVEMVVIIPAHPFLLNHTHTWNKTTRKCISIEFERTCRISKWRQNGWQNKRPFDKIPNKSMKWKSASSKFLLVDFIYRFTLGLPRKRRDEKSKVLPKMFYFHAMNWAPAWKYYAIFIVCNSKFYQIEKF